MKKPILEINGEIPPLTHREIVELIETVLVFEAYTQHECEVHIHCVDQNAITQLNRDHRQKDKPTNVLSFPYRHTADSQEFLGDIILCLEVSSQEAHDRNIPHRQHIYHLLVHSVLHLLGHDHEDDADATSMEAKEAAILKQLHQPNPYG